MNKEDLQFTINRFDTYFESANNKGNFYIGYNIFVLGGLLTVKKEFSSVLNKDLVLTNLCLLLTFLCCLSILYILLSSLPFLKSGNNKHYKSLFFFGSISSMKYEFYKDKVQASNEESILVDLKNQSYCLAKGLHEKYQYLKYGGISMIIQVILLMVIIFKLILN